VQIQIITVGKNKVDYLVQGEEDFLHRLKHYCKIDVHCVKPEKITENRSPETIKQTEGKKLSQKIPPRSYVIALDEIGKSINSNEFAGKIADYQNRSVEKLIFIIGGPLGLSREVLSRADFILSLSEMTFSHDMVRLILLEQLYRSFTILRGEKYHK
jgi:23S rRNA (pseudouridine1915-N3)-methyltransferase